MTLINYFSSFAIRLLATVNSQWITGNIWKMANDKQLTANSTQFSQKKQFTLYCLLFSVKTEGSGW